MTSRGNFVKEHRFHDATLAAAKETVDLTIDLVSTVWRVIHRREGPSWLPKREGSGRFERVTVQLLKQTSD
ncbi:MAG: hypothetical protein ICCCNLDF_03396 [Planctomycetes bacterium]|nr:hypothetical protein [Planctomycetota bacterium]